MRHVSTGLFSSGIAAVAMLGFVALTGCVASKPAARPHSTVLLSVVMEGRVASDRQPAGIIVGVDEQQASGGQQFAFAPNTRIPGHYTTFLARLDLAPGQHHLTRLSGVAGNGTPAPEFDVVMDMPFEVKARETRYLGHLEWSYASSTNVAPAAGDAATEAHLVLADAYEDDLPGLVHAWPGLRGHSIARHAPAQIVSIPAGLRDPTALAHSRERGERALPVARLDLSAAASLPQEARPAFRVFLTKTYPRAFAIADSGQIGVAAGGSDVIQRALRNCRQKLIAPLPGAEPTWPALTRAAPKSTCRLFAVDDTLAK